jgi:hypothetical protein
MAYKFEVSPNAKEVGDYTIFTKNCLGLFFKLRNRQRKIW